MSCLLITKVLSSAYKGDLAIAIAMLERISGSHPDWELTILCRNPTQDADRLSEFGVVGRELFSGESRQSDKAKIFFRLLTYLLWAATGRSRLDAPGQRFVEACKQADALVFCGGGSPGGYGMTNLVLHALVPVLLARRLGTRIVFTGMGAEPVHNRAHRKLLRWVLNQAHAISVRDPRAGQTMRELGVETPITVAADWAFGLTSSLPSGLASRLATLSESQSRPLIGLNLRAENARGPEREQRKGAAYRTLMQQVATDLLERTPAILCVVSMTRSARTDDYAFALAIRQELPASLRARFVVFEAELPPEVIKGVVGAMSIFIATRLHPLVFAVSQGIPTLAVHDLRKVSGFMAYCGLSDWYIPVTNAVCEHVVAKALELAESRDQIARQLRRRLPELSAAVDRNLDVIEAQLNQYHSRRRPPEKSTIPKVTK